MLVSNIKKSDGSSLGTLGQDWFLKYYDGASRATNGVGANWKAITNDDLSATPTLKLNKYQGYIIALNNGSPATEISFTLDKTALSTEITQIIPIAANIGSASNTHHGWNLIGQPYLSKYTGSNATGSSSYYIYVSDGTSTYTAYTPASVPELNPMSAYFIQASNDLAISGINFALEGRKSAVPSSIRNEASTDIEISLTTVTGVDKTTLILSDGLSVEYEIGKDLEKWIGIGTNKPQIFTQLNSVNYTFNALPLSSFTEIPLGYYSNNACSSTISASISKTDALSELILIDNHTKARTNLLQNSYNFDATSGIDNTRFNLLAKHVSTKTTEINTQNTVKCNVRNNKLTIYNLPPSSLVMIYDGTGRMIYKNHLIAESLQVELPAKGLYVLDTKYGTQNWTSKITTN
ncbi:MAG: hypothetical protein KA206_00850 [Paludibacter sp.]|nr:hypothetical protein [Paludibacter sp.]